MDAAQQATESASAVVAKVAPPVTVSLATVAGISVSEILVWATLLYTVIMIGYKVYQIYKEVKKD
jgi:hypothetical protein